MELETPKPNQVQMSDTIETKCPCGHPYFREVVALREVSVLYTKTGRSEYVPMPVLVCDKCNTKFERPSLLVPA